MRIHSLPLRFLLAAPLGAALVAPSPGLAQSRADLYRQVLALRAVDLDGSTWNHERLRGRIVLLDFWATWCAPCVRELPWLKRARVRYEGDFEVVGISLDTRDRGSLVDWLRRHGVDWPQVHQRRGWEDRLPTAFGVDRLPRNLLLDREGRLRAMDVRGEALLVEIERLLAEERDRGGAPR